MSLVASVAAGRTAEVRAKLEEGESPDTVDSEGNPLLHLAVRAGGVEIKQLSY